MVKAFVDWKSGTITDNDFITVVDSVGISNIPSDGMSYPMFKNYISSSFNQVQKTCDNVIPSYQNTYVSAICNDFSASQWKDLSTAIDGACIMPEIASEGTASTKATTPLSQSVLVQKLCQTRTAAFPWNLPENKLVSSGVDSMFGFLEDKEKYLTFGSSSPFSMSWTTTIKDSWTQQVQLDIDQSEVGTHGGIQEVNPLMVFIHFDEYTGTQHGYSVTLGKSSDSSHIYERTVTVTFQDDDNGMYV
jgi:hypothetical protein